LEIAEQNSTLIINCKLFETSKKNALKNLNILKYIHFELFGLQI